MLARERHCAAAHAPVPLCLERHGACAEAHGGGPRPPLCRAPFLGARHGTPRAARHGAALGRYITRRTSATGKKKMRSRSRSCHEEEATTIKLRKKTISA
ncbi:hypothetical protein ACMD2_17023 [Ananas comosus]|uniref:Uncharacterized protein n=1 Tax=Ananas comosus TaxID=4615 RepID=A0A199VI34_ANACO|nr:hypothetical protein ACMD2_17023 [Ananas comosus]